MVFLFSVGMYETPLASPYTLKTLKPYTTIPSLDKIFNKLISFLKIDTLF